LRYNINMKTLTLCNVSLMFIKINNMKTKKLETRSEEVIRKLKEIKKLREEGFFDLKQKDKTERLGLIGL